jgi:hypothetical protein
MVCELGMSPLGPVHFRRPSSARDVDGGAAGFSEEAARRVDDEIRALVMRGYDTARQIIERQRAAVRALALELLEVESVDADRLKQIIAEHVDVRSVRLQPDQDAPVRPSASAEGYGGPTGASREGGQPDQDARGVRLEADRNAFSARSASTSA